MYCKLCGKHLYENITFENIFKFNYFMHKKCEEQLNHNEDYITFPLLDKLVFHDYLFDEVYEQSNRRFLYEKYAVRFYERLLKNNDWSIVLFIDSKLNNDTMILVTKLADKAILFCSIFNENFF